MNNKKKMTAGAWVTCIAAVVTIVALIIYQVNIGGAGYFQNASVSNLVLYTVCAVALFLLAIVVGLALKGAAGELISGILQIGAPVLIALALISLIASRVEGLGFIYFSNADVTLEVQTPENLSSAQTAIASMVAYGVAMLCGIIAAFTSLKRKEA